MSTEAIRKRNRRIKLKNNGMCLGRGLLMGILSILILKTLVKMFRNSLRSILKQTINMWSSFTTS